jgi:hypothetical protein
MMAGTRNQDLRETDLCGPIRDYLLAQGYSVRCEVEHCDITATLGEELVVIELKRGFTTDLLIQATQRQRAADAVYVALPRPRGREARSARWRGAQHLLHRLELGLILVSFGEGDPLVEIIFHPLPFEGKRDSRRRRAILREIAGRSGDHNEGGSTRRKLLTAYRERALRLAYHLAEQGPLSPEALRALGTGDKTQAILARNVYGWFERVERGIYGLKPAGREALDAYPELVARFRAEAEEGVAETPPPAARRRRRKAKALQTDSPQGATPADRAR